MTVKVQAELTARDDLSPKLIGLERSLEKFRIGVESNSKGIRKLENSFEGVALQATQLDGNLGKLADGLVEFAPGGFVGLAVIAGVAAIIKYFQDLDKAQVEAAKSAKDLSYSLLEALHGADAVAQSKYLDSLDKVKKAEQDLRNLRLSAAAADKEALLRSQARIGAAAQPISTIDRKKEAELIKASTDALNETVQLGIRVTDNDKRNKEKLARQQEIAGKDSKTLLEKQIKEREDLYKYSAEQSIKFEDNLQKTIDGIISDGQEKRKLEAAATAKRTEELLTSLKIPTTAGFAEQLQADFAGQP
jgi:hypothetical protein